MQHKRELALGLLVYAGIFMTSPVQAQEAKCAEITESVERIRCQMENIAEEAAAGGTWEPPEKQWQLVYSKSAMTDEQGVYGSLTADGGFQCGVSGTRRPPVLRVQCHENETRVILDAGCFMADSGGFGKVRMRVDDERPVIMHFTESADNSSLGLWGARAARPFLEAISGSKSLMLEFAAYREPTQVARFKPDGVQKVIAAVRSECGW